MKNYDIFISRIRKHLARTGPSKKLMIMIIQIMHMQLHIAYVVQCKFTRTQCECSVYNVKQCNILQILYKYTLRQDKFTLRNVYSLRLNLVTK